MRKKRNGFAGRWMGNTALALAGAFVLMSVPMDVHAETFYGQDGWSVVFDGDSMNSTFTNADIDDTIYQMQPGDTADIHLTLTNDYDGDTDWYMTNEILQTLEDSQSVAEGGAYTYILTYIRQDGTEEILYSSEEIGGETINASGEGLHQATDSLEDYFYLDTLSSGQSGQIRLVVELEGETQGNAYQNTLAQLQMNFAVELSSAEGNPETGETSPSESTQETTPGGTTPEETTAGNTPSGTNPPGTVVKTGDTAQIELWSIVTLALGVLCLILAVIKITVTREGRGAGREGKGGRR